MFFSIPMTLQPPNSKSGSADVKFNDTNYARLLPHLGDRGFLQPDLTTQLKARSVASA